MKMIGKNGDVVTVTVQVKSKGQKSKSLTLLDTSVDEVFNLVNEKIKDVCKVSDEVEKNEKAI